MKYYKVLALIFLGAVLFLIGLAVLRPDKTIDAGRPDGSEAQADASSQAGGGWLLRCAKEEEEAKKDTGHPRCEVFQRLMVAKTNQRFIDVVVGFPKGRTDAMGIIVMPLGVLLQPGMQMKIDNGPVYAFNARYCDKTGCFCYIDLKAPLLEKLRKGSKLILAFKTANKKTVSVDLPLEGFAKALDKITDAEK